MNAKSVHPAVEPTLTPPLTIEQVKKGFEACGDTVHAWAVRNGFEPSEVYRVLNGQNKATKGNGFAIAVALGMKTKPTTNTTGKITMKSTEINPAEPEQEAQPALVVPTPETEILPVLRPKVPRHHAQPYFDYVSLILVIVLIAAFTGWWVEAADRRLVQQQLDHVQIARIVDARSCQ